MQDEPLYLEAGRFLDEIKCNSKAILEICRPLVEDSNKDMRESYQRHREYSENQRLDQLSVINFSVDLSLAYSIRMDGSEVVSDGKSTYTLWVFQFGKHTTCSNGEVILAVEKYVRDNFDLSKFPRLKLQ